MLIALGFMRSGLGTVSDRTPWSRLAVLASASRPSGTFRRRERAGRALPVREVDVVGHLRILRSPRTTR
jgi:hypothetical protein